MYARRRCLYDHLQQLQDLLEEAGIDGKIPVEREGDPRRRGLKQGLGPHNRHSTPHHTAIPGLRPIPGERGLLNGLGPPAEDGLTARRTGNAWLVVAGGSGLAQRIELLRHLTGIVRL